MQPDDLANLDLDAVTMRSMLDAVSERVVEHLASLERQPSRGDLTDVEARCRELREPPPEHGEELQRLLAPLFDDWIVRSFNCPGPGYLAYIPGGGLFPAALADLIANAVNRYTGVWNAAPLLVQLEANVLDWLRVWMGYPARARGLLTPGGSMANFVAVVTAREAMLGSSLRDGVLYTSTQAHHSVAKSARLAGILDDRVRVVAVDERLRLDVDALAEAVRTDRTAGLVPFMVVSAAGTTNTGAVDPLAAVNTVCRREGLWHHVDAAYGGFFALCPELGPVLAGLGEADSITLDPHKGLFLPYGTGALLVRDGERLHHAHAAHGSYLPPVPDDDLYDPCQYGPELSRPYRGLAVWLSLKLFGAARFRAALREKHELAHEAAREIASLEHVVMVAPPELSLFAFHLRWPGSTLADENLATEKLMERVCARGRVMVSGATVGERYLGRVCVLCFRTRALHVAHAVEDIRHETAAIVREAAG